MDHSPNLGMPGISLAAQVWVNHKYRIIYLRHAKTGSSSLFCHFNGCRDANANGQAATAFVPLQVGREGLAGWRAGRPCVLYVLESLVMKTGRQAGRQAGTCVL